MHIHLPKSLHGWREFLKEYAIVVLGVLTALALEQAVESVHDHRVAREAHEAIRQEMQTDLDRIAYRLTQQACIDKRLDEIQALLAGWRGDDAFPAGLHIGFPGDVGMVDQRWEANLASGGFNEESPQEQADQASIYTLIQVIDKIENQEVGDWAELRALELGSRTLSPAAKPMLASALAHGRADGHAIEELSGAMLAGLRGDRSERTGLTPRNDFVPASPGTTCDPMRAASSVNARKS